MSITKNKKLTKVEKLIIKFEDGTITESEATWLTASLRKAPHDYLRSSLYKIVKEFDYLEKLSLSELIYLRRFNNEFYLARLCDNNSLHKNDLKTKTQLRQAMYKKRLDAMNNFTQVEKLEVA